MKARIRFEKDGAMRFVGHLDMMRYFQKAIRRANIPIAFTAGYSPHMIMSFASPLAIGLSSDAEYFDIELTEFISSKEAVERLNEQMVEGVRVTSFLQISDEKKMTGMALVSAADYWMTPIVPLPADWETRWDAFLAQPEILVTKKSKRSTRTLDIKPLIYDTNVQDGKVFLRLASGSAENLKPELVMDAFLTFLGMDSTDVRWQIHRSELYAVHPGGEGFQSLEAFGSELVHS